MEKYQLDGANNARIFIDYRKEKDKVKFEYVANDSIFKLAFGAWLRIWFNKSFYLFPFLILVGIRHNKLNQMDLI